MAQSVFIRFICAAIRRIRGLSSLLSRLTLKPKQARYDGRETDEFWTYAGKKKNNVRLMYTYDRKGGEIVVPDLRFAVWGKRDLKTAKKLKGTVKTAGNKLLSRQRQTMETVSFWLLRETAI
jgi:hypothetical protein